MISAAPNTVSCMADLEYTHRPTGALALDLFLPTNVSATTNGAPLVLYLHGGAWVMGSRRDHPQRMRHLAAQGLAVASLDYRPAHRAAFPAQREDVAAAIEFLRRDEERFGVNASAVGLYGASAGAHLAAMAALTLSESTDAAVFAFAGIFGRYDLTSAGLVPVPEPGLRAPDEVLSSPWPVELGGRPVSPMKLRSLLTGVEERRLDDEALRAVSPIYLLDRADVPIMVLHGIADGVTHHAHGENFVRAARSAGRDAEIELIEGANHEDPWFDGPEAGAKLGGFFHRGAHSSSMRTRTAGSAPVVTPEPGR